MRDAFKICENFRSFLVSTWDTTDAVLKCLKDTFKAFGNAIFFYVLICFLFYLFNEKYGLININKFLKNFRRVLIVTAHPDDECMFFGPLIIKLTKQSGCQVFLLCLSSGDHYNLGSKRKQELWNSCETLGIHPSNIIMCKDPHMKDNPNVVWRKEEVAKVILYHADSLNVDTIVTFDEDGVSGHYNHISIFNAVCLLTIKNKLPSGTKVYALESVNLFRKYTNCIDALLTYLTSECVCYINKSEHTVVENAMKKHETQYVWFRKLYIIFSRYAYINSFRLIDKSNAFLEMYDFNAE